MRLRSAILGVALAIVLTSCGGGGDDDEPSAVNTRLGAPSESVTETTIDCAKFNDTAQKIVRAQQEMFAGSGGSTEALDSLTTQLDALKEGAPGDVKAAIDELESAFEKVHEVIQNPNSEAQAELAEMAPKLSADGQKITTYIVSQCK